MKKPCVLPFMHHIEIYLTQPVTNILKVVRQRPKTVDVEKIYKVPKYIFEDQVEYVDVYEELFACCCFCDHFSIFLP